MAMYRVLKPFNTPLRRFRVVGDERDQLEFDGPLGIQQLVKAGFIKPVVAEQQQHAATAPKIQAKRDNPPEANEDTEEIVVTKQ